MRPNTLNLIWLVGVLLATVAWLLIDRSNGDKIQEYLGFASSIAALILATIAIFQTIVSQRDAAALNTGLQRSVTEVENAARNVAQISGQLSNQQKEFVGHVQRVPEELEELRRRVTDAFDSKRKLPIDPSESTEIEGLLDDTPFANQIVWMTIAESIRANKNINPKNIFTDDSYLVGWLHGALTSYRITKPLGIELTGVQSDEGGIIFRVSKHERIDPRALWEEFAQYPLDNFDNSILQKVFDYFETEWPEDLPKIETDAQRGDEVNSSQDAPTQEGKG